MQTAAYSAEATPEPRVESQASSAGEPGPAPGDEGFATRRVFVHNLPFETKWSDLKDHFSAAGPVAFASVRPNKVSSAGSGVVLGPGRGDEIFGPVNGATGGAWML